MAIKEVQRATPFIKRLPLEGGGFYTFSSAAEDLTLSLNDGSNKKVRFSKFALLNIPDILNEQFNNTVKLNAIPGAWNSVNFQRTTDYNVHFSESFQNYCLNLETMMLSSDGYDPNENATVSERVFFKWLKSIGAIRFKEAVSSGLTNTRYLEEDDGANYSKVIQYIGNIDVVNNLSGNVNSNLEVYINIPTEVGNTPNVMFKSMTDNNYSSGMSFCRTQDGLDNEIISGRHYNDNHPDNLDIHAYYDNEAGLYAVDQQGAGITLYKKISTRTDSQDVIQDDYNINSWWFEPNSNSNCYYTEPSEFTNPGNDDLAIVSDQETLKFRRSKLDGITLDFDIANYNAYDPYVDGKTLYDLAMSYDSADFEFNAVLLYYDIYERTLGESDAFTDNVLATNLFGVLFLDNLETTSQGGGTIPRFKKCRPNQVLDLNGNAYSFKINLKLNISPINSGVEVETFISDSNTFSMDVFADALREMLNLSQSIVDIDLSMLSIENRLRTLEDSLNLTKINKIDDLQKQIDDLKNQISNGAWLSNLTDRNNMVNQIQKNYDLVNDVLTNKTSVNVAYDLSHLVDGAGIKLVKKGDMLVVERSNQEYSYSNNIFVKSTDLERKVLENNNTYLTYETTLQPFKNYIRFDEGNNANVETSHSVILYIKDDNVQWSRGQSYKIYFANPYIIRNNNDVTQLGDFWIYTDYNNLRKVSGITNYSTRIKIAQSNFGRKRYLPIIELQCINDDYLNLEFIIDIQ